MFDLIVYGITFADLVFADFPHLPSPGEEVYAQSFNFSGGAAYITAVAASRLGLRVGLVAPFGNDLMSRLLEDMLRQEGVDTRLLFRVNHPVYNITVSINHGGDRGFLSYQDGVNEHDLSQYASDIVEHTPSRWVHLGAGRQSAPVAIAAKRAGAGISMDVGWNEPWLKSPELLEVVRLADVFMPNMKEALAISGKGDAKSAANFLNNWVPCIVVKLGSEGALVKLTDQEMRQVRAPKVEHVQDTTGAGDNFAAGLIYGLLSGMDTVEAVQMGNFCGSESTKGFGGNATSPWLETLKSQGKKEEGVIPLDKI